MSTALTEELARIVSQLSPEAIDAGKRLAKTIDEVIDQLAALEQIAVYGRDCETLAEHLVSLRELQGLRQKFEGRGVPTGPAEPGRMS